MKQVAEIRTTLAVCFGIILLAGVCPCRAEEHDEEEGDWRDREHLERRERERDWHGDDGRPRSFDELVRRVARHLPERGRRDIIAFANEQCADLFRDARDIFAEEFSEATELVETAFRESMELLELRRENPEEFERAVRQRKLERQAEQLAEKAEALEGKAREETIAKLKKTLAESFDMRQQDMRREMHELETEATRIKNRVEKRQKHRDQIIERRVKELTGALDDLEW